MSTLVGIPRETPPPGESARAHLVDLLRTKAARIAIVGLGYVGLPLGLEFARRGFSTAGIDIDAGKAAAIQDGRSPLVDVRGDEIAAQIRSGRLEATSDFGRLSRADGIFICVPTPLSYTNDPDLSYIEAAVDQVARHLRSGQLVVLESTTYPGCTDELLLPRLRATGLQLDRDFLLAFSPERVDPGNARFRTANVPRVVGGCSPDSLAAARVAYEQVTTSVHTVSSARVAETTKLLENTFRAINIGLVNELALMCEQMDIDIWEVIAAAATKPYGFMPFYPGPGIGGHCIPLDPAYLSWKGREFGFESRFINLALQLNRGMPHHVLELIAEALNAERKALNGSRILLLGVAYKKDVNDVRESPALDIVRLLLAKGADVSYHDPFVPDLVLENFAYKTGRTGPRPGLAAEKRLRAGTLPAEANGRLRSVALTTPTLQNADCVAIVTDHTSVDYAAVARDARLIVDTRNALTTEIRAAARARVVRL